MGSASGTIQTLKTERFNNVKILAMSREESDIKITMKDLGLSGSLSNPHVDDDIANYIDNELLSHTRLRTYPAELKKEIRSELVKRACGM
jgi:hypothetical protein